MSIVFQKLLSVSFKIIFCFFFFFLCFSFSLFFFTGTAFNFLFTLNHSFSHFELDFLLAKEWKRKANRHRDEFDLVREYKQLAHVATRNDKVTDKIGNWTLKYVSIKMWNLNEYFYIFTYIIYTVMFLVPGKKKKSSAVMSVRFWKMT